MESNRRSEVSVECPLCDGSDIVTDPLNNERICTGCGCVVNDVMLHRGRDNKAYNPRDWGDSRRYGMWIRQSSPDKGMNTLISGSHDGYGNPLSKEAKATMNRLRRRDNRSKIDDSVMRNLNIAMTQLDRVCSMLHLPVYAKEYAALIYRKALERDMIRGRSIDEFVVASVYLAIRMLSIPRSLQRVVERSKRDYHGVARTYRLLREELGLKPPIDTPLKFVPRLCNELGVPRPTERLATELLREAREKHALIGKDPRGVAGAAIYLALEMDEVDVVQRRVAEAADTTEVTLRTRYRGLKKALDIE